MLASRASSAPRFRPLGRADFDAVLTLPLHDPATVAFLDPVQSIVDAVRASPAHRMVGIEDEGGLVGFFVIHPDRRDLACWWVGWLAICPARQGTGLGRRALAEIAATLARVDGCRRVRLLVAPGNVAAQALYGRAAFRRIGTDADGWHLLEWSLPPRRPAGRSFSRRATQAGARPAGRRDRRVRRRLPSGSVAVRATGPLHGPPHA